MAKPRLLVVTPDFPPAKGGIQILSHRLVSSLRRMQPIVVTLGYDGAGEFDCAQPFRVLRVRSGLGSRALDNMALITMASVLAHTERPDAVLSMHIVAAPAAAFIGRRLAIPWVQYVHAKEIGAKPSLARFALTRADLVVAVSQYTSDLATNAGAAPGKTVRIAPGVETARRSSATPKKWSEPTLVTVARLEDRYKGHDVIMRAFPLVRAKVPAARWRVIGDGPLRSTLEVRARGLGLGDAVTFLGAVDDETRDREMAMADAFCMVSRLPAGGFAGEGFGIVYLEAGAVGLPVIAGDVGGAVDAVLDNETGLLVDPEDHLAVAHAIVEVLTHPGRARRMGAAGRKHAESMNWETAAGRLESEIERLLR